MSEKKVVGRRVFIALEIVCIILLACLVGATSLYQSQINDKDNTISSLSLKISQSNTNNTNLQNQIASLNSTISSLNTQVASLQNQAQALQTQMNELLNETTIPLSYSYTVGDYMTYNITTTVIQFGQNMSGNPVGTPAVQTQTGTINMDVISFDGENYTINETASMQLASLPISFTIMEKINKTGYVTILSGPFATFNSMLAGLNSPGTFFQKDEAKVGETWQFPISEFGNLSFGLTGNFTFTFGSIQNITVPAGTYRVFSLDVSGSNLTMSSSVAGVSCFVQASCIGHEYLEYGTCRLIDSSFQENISYQTGGQSSTSIDFMQMELVQDTNH
jgi:cell division protein FtsL